MVGTKTNPAKVLWEACTAGVVNYLQKHRIFRFFVAIFGALIFIIGLLSSILWNVPILSWLDGKDIALPLLAAGGYTLGVWYMSRNRP
jgi:hypothetical protein